MASRSAAPPPAWNSALSIAAENHNAATIAADTQSHQLSGEASLGTRITNAGYTDWPALGDNVYAFSSSHSANGGVDTNCGIRAGQDLIHESSDFLGMSQLSNDLLIV